MKEAVLVIKVTVRMEQTEHELNPSAWSDGHCPHAAHSHSFVYISTS